MKSKKIRVFPFRALCPANFTDDGLRWNPISFFKNPNRSTLTTCKRAS